MKIDDALVDQIVGRVMEALRVPSVELEASGRHCHLTRKAVEALFGPGYRLTPAADLSQPGQYACRERLEVRGPKGSFPSVAVLGPEREDDQLELSRSDALALGIPAPLRLSGDTSRTPGAVLVGPRGQYEMKAGTIVALRHVHMTPGDAARFGLAGAETVDVRVDSPRGMVFTGVPLRVSPSAATYMHIDYDDANACGFQKGMRGRLLIPGAPTLPSPADASAPAAEPAAPGALDLTDCRVVTEQLIRDAHRAGAVRVRLCPRAIVTALAADCAREKGIALLRE